MGRRSAGDHSNRRRGGDKPIRGLTEPGERNPFLGVRGLQALLRRPEIFAVQLRALARAAVSGNLKVMFPDGDDPGRVSCRARSLSSRRSMTSRGGRAG